MNNSEATIAALFNQSIKTIHAWRRNGTLEGYNSRQVYDTVKRLKFKNMINQVLWEQIKEEAERTLERKVYKYIHKGAIPTKTMNPKMVTEWYETLGFVWGLGKDENAPEGVPDEAIKRCHIRFDIRADQGYTRPVSDLVGPLIYALKYGDIIKSVGSRCVLRTIVDSQKCEKGMDVAEIQVEEIF